MEKIEVNGLTISMLNKSFVSLTDIAKRNTNDRPGYELIRAWLRNSSTLEYLHEWEKIHNPNFNSAQMRRFEEYARNNRNTISPAKYLEMTNPVGIVHKQGRYGGTFSHTDIAVNFCYWLSPKFQVYLVKEFQRLKEQEYEIQNLEWHISKITENIDEVRNLLDTIPFQKQRLNDAIVELKEKKLLE